ncbi:hypothetical protein [Natronomonas salsuginis]|uniref:Uncharacterized protein n=1 Tax=Natronomonas salsuginis TaxID=2217661 RepID=A0A4U5JH30_9EURY|nr:hypothetical protein [Natronomonas salsuginis]TKR27611.1 hypothetical protein DM868_00505 [Natronomonas salsuginis]
MVEFTFLELHFENSDLTANAPYSHGEKNVDASDEPPAEESASGSKKRPVLALLIGLCFSVAVAYLVRKRVFAGGEDDVVDEEDAIPV